MRFVTDAALTAVAIGVAVASPTNLLAQTSGPPEEAGLSYESIKAFFDPISSWLAHIAYPFAHTWYFLLMHPPAAVILSAILASTVAIVSIRHNRATTKLRETFTKTLSANWDKDVIEARKDFWKLKTLHSENLHEITKYCHSYPSKADNESQTTMINIVQSMTG